MIWVLVAVGALILGAAGLLWAYGGRWGLLSSATWRMLREGGWRRFLHASFLHGVIYGRWPHLYAKLGFKQVIPRLGRRGKNYLANRHHGKVLTSDQARAIITIDQPIRRDNLEHVIPYPLARALVIEGPPDIAAYECACRASRDNPCEPTQVCMAIGQPYVDFVLEHNRGRSRRLTTDEALQLLQEEHERGHMHSAWFKDSLLGRMYSICNCCKCCCGGLEAMVKHGVPMVVSSGFVAVVEQAACQACGACAQICPFDAITVSSPATVEWAKCMGCGLCVGICPAGALELVRDVRKGEPLDVRTLIEQDRQSEREASAPVAAQ